MLFLSQFGQAFGFSAEGSFFMYFIALFAAIASKMLKDNPSLTEG